LLEGELRTRQPKLDIRVQISGPRCRLKPEIETILFSRHARALSNVARHARASRAEVRLTFASEAITLSVDDDGVGFAPTQVLDDRSTVGRTKWGLLGTAGAGCVGQREL